MFCIAKGYESKGVGKVISIDQESCTIEYFDTPNSKERETLIRPEILLYAKDWNPIPGYITFTMFPKNG